MLIQILHKAVDKTDKLTHEIDFGDDGPREAIHPVGSVVHHINDPGRKPQTVRGHIRMKVGQRTVPGYLVRSRNGRDAAMQRSHAVLLSPAAKKVASETSPGVTLPTLHSPKYVRTEEGVRSQYAPNKTIDRHVYAYQDHEGNTFHKSFETGKGRLPRIPQQGTHGQIAKFGMQHPKVAGWPTIIQVIRKAIDKKDTSTIGMDFDKPPSFRENHHFPKLNWLAERGQTLSGRAHPNVIRDAKKLISQSESGDPSEIKKIVQRRGKEQPGHSTVTSIGRSMLEHFGHDPEFDKRVDLSGTHGHDFASPFHNRDHVVEHFQRMIDARGYAGANKINSAKDAFRLIGRDGKTEHTVKIEHSAHLTHGGEHVHSYSLRLPKDDRVDRVFARDSKIGTDRRGKPSLVSGLYFPHRRGFHDDPSFVQDYKSDAEGHSSAREPNEL